MTLQQLEELLKLWRQRLPMLAEGLLELQAESTAQGITGAAQTGRAKPSGTTAAQAARIAPRVHRLFQQFSLLQQRVEAAEALRSGLPAFFGGEAKLLEAEKLLLGSSIQFESDEPAQFADLGKGLGSGAQDAASCTPEQLLQAMTRSLAEVRASLAVISEATAAFAAHCQATEQEVQHAKQQTAMPSLLLAADFEWLEEQLVALRVLQEEDALGALDRLQHEVEPRLASIRHRITRAEQVSRQLAVARCQWETLLQVRAQAEQACAELAEKFCGVAVQGEPTPEVKLKGLSEWLARLEIKCEEGACEAVEIGLRNWTAAMEACLGGDRALVAAAQEKTGRRAELQGRFEALRAKARAMDNSMGLHEVAAKVATLLKVRPMNLCAAEAAVAHFEQDLRAGTLNTSAPAAASTR